MKENGKQILDEEMELEKTKFQAWAKLKKSMKTSLEDSKNPSSVGVKLPKIEIRNLS